MIAATVSMPTAPLAPRKRRWTLVVALLAIPGSILALTISEGAIRHRCFHRDFNITPSGSEQHPGALLIGRTGPDFLYAGPHMWRLTFENHTGQALTGIKVFADGSAQEPANKAGNMGTPVNSLDAGNRLVMWRNHDTQSPGAALNPPKRVRIESDQGVFEWDVR